MADELQGRVAIVTGATGGMGRAICKRLVEAGASVVATDLTATADLPDGVSYHTGDVSNPDHMQAVVASTIESLGRLDCAVNAAGIEFETVPLADCADDDFDQMMAVNTKGVFLSMKYELRALIQAGNGGSIVNIASTNSFRPQPSQPAYTASKHAVLGLTRSAAIDYAQHNIRVNCIAPGAINTPMLHSAVERRNRDLDDVAKRLSYFGRVGEAREIADAALFLCSDASTFTTGHALSVDGGMLAG